MAQGEPGKPDLRWRWNGHKVPGQRPVVVGMVETLGPNVTVMPSRSLASPPRYHWAVADLPTLVGLQRRFGVRCGVIYQRGDARVYGMMATTQY